MRAPEIFCAEYASVTVTIYKVGRTGLANFIYAVTDRATKDTVLFDPGWEHELIVDQLMASGHHLVAILLTHADEDHTSGVEKIHQALKVPIYLSDLEQYPENLPTHSLKTLNHLDELQLGSIRVLCIHTPGHSPGSFCFMIDGLIFTGDTLFNEGCGYCEPPSGSVSEMFRSLTLLRRQLGDEIIVFPAHQYKSPPGLTMGQICRINPYLKIKDLDSFAIFSQRRLVNIPAMNE